MLAAAHERKWPLRAALVAAVFAGAGLYAWLGHGARVSPESSIQQSSAAVSAPTRTIRAAHVLDTLLTFKTEALKGRGVPAIAWLEEIRQAAPEFVHYQPADLPDLMPPLWLSDYEGDATLPLNEALTLLRFAGLRIERAPKQGYEISWETEASKEATAADSLSWGVFHPWRKFTLRLDDDLKSATPSAAERGLAWSADGKRLQIENSPDGPITKTRSESAKAFAKPPISNVALQAELSAERTALDVAGPNWRRVSLNSITAAEMLRSNDRLQITAALWRWNRPGADESTVPIENESSVLIPPIESILANSPSATLRRLALEALYREGDRHAGTRIPALIEVSGPALATFRLDSDPQVQLAAASILGRTAGVAEVEALVQGSLAHPPAGIELVLSGVVQRFWQAPEVGEQENRVLNVFIDKLIDNPDPQISSRAASAKMQDPALDLEAKVRIAKSFKLPAQRVAALQALNFTRKNETLPAKLAAVFLYDSAPEVREAVFTTRLLERMNPGAERTKFYSQGLDDEAPNVRQAAQKYAKSMTVSQH